ncbi:MAG: ABC transporter substrate-binding protein [SAR202 cluster bacterium]|nr:ABC transporter substrate-binding protein [SAR202 cluster bacterium]
MYHRYGRFGLKTLKVVVPVLLLSLLAVACGTAATATPSPKPTAAAPTSSATAPTALPVPTPTVAAPAAGVAPTAVPATAAPPAAPVVNPGKVTWMMTGFGTERFDPAYASSSGHDYGRIVHTFLFSSDVKDGARVMTPGIITKWELSPDGLTWTFTVGKGAKFHDGTPVTAADVAWTLGHVIGPQSKEYVISSIPLALSALLVGIEQPGPDQVKVNMKSPVADFPLTNSEAASSWIGVVLPKRASLHDLTEEAAYDRNPIGAGPMKVVKHVAASEMTLERFADYYHQPKNGYATDKRVNYTTMSLRLIPEEATRVAALRAGEGDIGPVSLASRKQVEAGNGRIVFGPEGVVWYVRLKGCWDTKFPCNKKAVRQALSYAINKELIRDKLYGGPEVMQLKGWHAVTPSTVGYSPELTPHPYDPNKARQLLAEAGYPGGQGFGKYVIHTWVSVSTPLMPEAAQLGAEFWRKELGLDVEVKIGDQAALTKAAAAGELWGAVQWGDDEARPDAAGHVRGLYANQERKDTAHKDPELFALAQNTLAIYDPVERQKAFNTMYQRLREESYYIPLGYMNVPWGVGPRIQSWQPYPLALYPSALHTVVLK